MTIEQMTQAIEEAKAELRRADAQASCMARILKGRLHQVDTGYTLSALKRELRDWDMHRNCWIR